MFQLRYRTFKGSLADDISKLITSQGLALESGNCCFKYNFVWNFDYVNIKLELQL